MTWSLKASLTESNIIHNIQTYTQAIKVPLDTEGNFVVSADGSQEAWSVNHKFANFKAAYASKEVLYRSNAANIETVN